MRKYLILTLIALSTTAIAEDFAELKIEGHRYRDKEAGIEFMIRNQFTDLHNVLITLDLNVVARDGIVDKSLCVFSVYNVPTDPEPYVIYSEGSIQFYFETIEALTPMRFAVIWGDTRKMLPESASMRIESDKGELSTEWHLHNYYHIVDPTPLRIYLDGNMQCRLG